MNLTTLVEMNGIEITKADRERDRKENPVDLDDLVQKKLPTREKKNKYRLLNSP
jgi:hypothetical protein